MNGRVANASTKLVRTQTLFVTGAEHMRSAVPFPANAAMYPRLLQQAGYYTTNNLKEDYNFREPAQGRVGRIVDGSPLAQPSG